VKKKVAWLATLAAILTVVVAPATASASGYGHPIITIPRPNATVASGFTGPITVDFSNASVDSYWADLSCDSTDQTNIFTYDDAGDDIQTWALKTAIVGPQDCYLTLDGDTVGMSARADFTVAAPPPPPLVLDKPSIAPATFYPQVHDGYRDSTTVKFRLNRTAAVTATVKNSVGDVVRRAALGSRSAGQRTWTWNGRTTHGTLVHAGAFHIQITAVADRTRSIGVSATVATAWRRTTVTRHRSGYAVSRSSHSRGCYVRRDAYDDSVELDCWAGSYATANYSFAVPASAYNVGWRVAGYQGCCSEGTISKWGVRLDRTHYRVSVKVTNWRSYTVTAVRLTYTYQRRI
jgi:hypothetical protein